MDKYARSRDAGCKKFGSEPNFAGWRSWSGGALVSALLALAACTSSDGGGTPGGSQEPDPVVLDFPIAYVKHPLPEEEMDVQLDARRLLDFREGGDLYVRDRASPSSAEINVTGEITGGLGDVRDVEPSYDGTKVVFAMREPLIEGADEEDQPTWNIWEYDVPARALRRVIPSDIIAEEGHDFAPHYLPDGRIVFASTRQRQSRAILLDEGKPQFEAQDEDRQEPAFVLHVMDADGSDIHQISFNQSHDLDPAVLDDGRVVFSRWDNAGPQSAIHLYAVRPDGSGLELLYGAQSHMTGTDGVGSPLPRPAPDGERRAAGARAAVHGRGLRRTAARDRHDELRRGHAGEPREQRRARRPRAEARDAKPGRDHPGALARRPLQLGVSAARRHRSHPRELEPVPAAGR